MPELPEVETIKRGVDGNLRGRRIRGVYGTGGRLVRNNPQGLADLRTHLTDAEVQSVQRRGKFMWVVLTDSDFALVVHLGMSGQVRISDDPQSELAKHEHVRLVLENDRVVSFVDPRTFGHLTISRLREDKTGRMIPEAAATVAPDPFEDVPPAVFTVPMGRTTRAVKTALLDQSLVSGIGNIYADEALFRAGVHGSRQADRLPPSVLASVIAAARDVMAEAIEVGGTSFDAMYVNAEGDPGYFERSLRVYGRHGQACVQCGGIIQRTVIGGRAHFSCKKCQPVPRRATRRG